VRLWHEFIEATSVHLRLLGQRQAAIIEQDSASLANLNEAMADSESKRQVACKAFKDHATIHADKPSA
jgi:hypothetical protein